MASLDEIRAVRIEKMNKLRAAGMDPYIAVSKRDTSIADVANSFDDLAASGTEKTISGRIMALRGQGAIVFANITDGTGLFQALLKKGELSDELFSLFPVTGCHGEYFLHH